MGKIEPALRVWARWACLCALFVPIGAQATVQQARTVAQLAVQADLVAIVRPRQAGSFHQGTRIFSLIDCEVLEVWRDSPHRQQAAQPTSVSVKLPGGTVHDIGQLIFGGPQLPLGQVRVAFLRWPASGTGEWEVVGMAQGLCSLGDDHHEATEDMWPGTAVRCEAVGAARTLGALQRQVRDVAAATP